MVNEKPVTESSNIVANDIIEKHPAERGGRRQRYVVLYSCCCCCCCCLHSLGGAIGVLTAGDFQPIESSSETKRGPSIQWLYWSSFLIATFLSAMGIAVFSYVSAPPMPRIDAVLLTPLYLGMGIILFGPIWLLAAGLVAAFRLAMRTDLPEAEKCWRKLGQIVSMSILGSIIGVLIMVVLFGILTL